jgi:hypothetical protein
MGAIMSDGEHRDGLFRVTAAASPFENLVALHVRWPGNRMGSKFPVDLLLEVEEHHLAVPIKPGLLRRIGQNLTGQAGAAEQVLRLRVRLRFCYVRYRSDAINIIADSKYESAITEGEFNTRTSEKARALNESRLAVGAGGTVGLKSRQATASLTARAAATFVRESHRTIEATTTTMPEIYEVRAVPSGWRIGDPDYGDPTKPSSLLDGRYFDQDVSGFPHTCDAEFLQGRERGFLTFAVTVRDGIHVERIGGGVANRSEEGKAVATMRDGIAALRLERHLRWSNNIGSTSDDEMPVATVTCEFVGASADEITREQPALSSETAVDRETPAPIARSRRSHRRQP